MAVLGLPEQPVPLAAVGFLVCLEAPEFRGQLVQSVIREKLARLERREHLVWSETLALPEVQECREPTESREP